MNNKSVKNKFSANKNVDLDILLKEIYKLLYDVEQLQWDMERSLVKTESILKSRQLLKRFREQLKAKDRI